MQTAAPLTPEARDLAFAGPMMAQPAAPGDSWHNPA
jgi:hypothetical protein